MAFGGADVGGAEVIGADVVGGSEVVDGTLVVGLGEVEVEVEVDDAGTAGVDCGVAPDRELQALRAPAASSVAAAVREKRIRATLRAVPANPAEAHRMLITQC